MEQQKRSEQSGMNERSSMPNKQQEKNQTVHEGSAESVTDYGRSQNLEREHGMSSDRQGNSSIPTDREDTLGNP